MRRLVALVLAAVLVTACGDEGDKKASTVPPQPTLPAGDTFPAPAETAPGATPPATTDVAPADAIGRLAASFTAQLISRQRKDARARAAGVPRPGRFRGLHPAAVRRRCVLQPVQGGHDQGSPRRVPRHLRRRRERVGHCDVDLLYFVDGDKAGQAQFRDTCPAPDDASAKRLEAMLSLATAWEVDPNAPPATTVS